MQWLAEPLNRLHEDLTWFVRAQEIRLMLLRNDADFRGPLVEALPKLEFHADNRSAWTLLADAHTRANDGWQLRSNNLAANWSRRVEAFAADGLSLTSVDAELASSGLLAFGRTAAAVSAAVAAPLEGIVIVLAPSVVEDAALLEAELTWLMQQPELATIRWVLMLDVDVDPPLALLGALGDARAMACECRIHRGAQVRGLAAMLDDSHPSEHFGMAWPRGVTPPPRCDDPPPLAPEAQEALLREAGIDPALVEYAPLIRADIFGAALAMNDGRGEQAIARQRSARDHCASAGLVELQVICGITLASYLSGLDHRDHAKRELDSAIALARANDLQRSESLACLALGLLQALEQDHRQAAHSYSLAASVAERGSEPLLAVEAWRLAGQMLLQAGDDGGASAAVGEALRVAGGTDPELARSSSASEAARQLAALCEARGLSDRAASLHSQADSIERGQRGTDASE